MIALEIAVLCCAVAVSLVVTRAMAALGRRLGAVEALGHRKIHRAPTPFLGGVGIFATLVLVVGGGLGGAWVLERTGAWPAFVPIEVRAMAMGLGPAKTQLAAVAGGAAALVALGLFDDWRGLRVPTRLLVQVGAATLALAGGLAHELRDVAPLLFWPVGLLWIVGMTNAFNFLDGMDGLCGGVAAIAAGILAVHVSAHGQPVVALFCLALVGATLGFLRWNFTPARIFLGNGGAMLLGFLLSSMTLEASVLTLGAQTVLPAILPLLVLGVPLYDACAVITIRCWNGRSPFAADTNHLHHRLKRTGMTDKQVVLFVYLLAFSLGINATLLRALDPAGGLVLLAQVCASLGLVVILERIIRRQQGEGDRLLALPADYAVVTAAGAAIDGLAGTGRVRALTAQGCVLEPGGPIGGDCADFLGGRWLVRLRLAAPAGAADAGALELLGQVRGLHADADGTPELHLELVRVSPSVRTRLAGLAAPTPPPASAPAVSGASAGV